PRPRQGPGGTLERILGSPPRDHPVAFCRAVASPMNIRPTGPHCGIERRRRLEQTRGDSRRQGRRQNRSGGFVTMIHLGVPSKRVGSRKSRRGFEIEPLEPRQLLAIIHVNSFEDVAKPPQGTITLRSAIIRANSDRRSDVIFLPSGLYPSF